MILTIVIATAMGKDDVDNGYHEVVIGNGEGDNAAVLVMVTEAMAMRRC